MGDIKMFKLSNGSDFIGMLYEDKGDYFKISWPFRLFISPNKQDPKLVDTSFLPLMPYMRDEFVCVNKSSIMCNSEVSDDMADNYLKSVDVYKKQQEAKAQISSRMMSLLDKSSG